MNIGILGFGAINQKVYQFFSTIDTNIKFNKILVRDAKKYASLNNDLITDIPEFFFQESFDYVLEGAGHDALFSYGPRVLKNDDEWYPTQPYGMNSNPYSILVTADIVFVCPVNTGYSRMIADDDGNYPKRETFFGINADIKYLASWINTFITRKNRWESPKYIIGESYGGTRVMGLSYELQNRHWMYLNGVIMVSPADYKLFEEGDAVNSSLHLPYYTATAWYHKALNEKLQSKDLYEILPEVEDFTINELIPAIAKGGFISDSEKNKIADKNKNIYENI